MDLSHMPAVTLFEQAYSGERDADDTWRYIGELRLRGTPEALDMAMEYCRSIDPRWREIGLEVLAQFGCRQPVEQRWYLSDCRDMAIEALDDPNIHVVRAAAMALAHLKYHCPCEETLLSLEAHPDAEVRLASACGLFGINSLAAQHALLRLMEDEDQDVRDWATMAIGQGDESSPQIMAALRKRWQEETFLDARDEAIWGLARFHDREASEELLRRFNADTWVSGDLEAICDLHGYAGDNPSVQEIIEATRYYLHTHP